MAVHGNLSQRYRATCNLTQVDAHYLSCSALEISSKW